jgi:protein phosphatase
MTLRYDIGKRGTIGQRKQQEDKGDFKQLDFASLDDAPTAIGSRRKIGSLLAVLADGMGGHVGGRRASRIAVAAFLDTYQDDNAPYSARLERSLVAANAAIGAGILEDASLKGMGCTIIGAVFEEDRLRWTSVGDSLLFLYRDGVLERLNEDHSLGPVLDKLVERGEMTAEAALNHPRRHYLRSALIGEEIELHEVQGEGRALESGDIVVLASDGIDTLERNELRDLIEQWAKEPADVIAANLVQAVEDHNRQNQDNTTVIVVKALGG